MKTIKEAADDTAHNCGLFMSDLSSQAEIGFKSGVAFAQRWIPIEEEKPEIDESVLMKNSFGCYGVGKWDGKDWTFYTIEGIAKLSNWISKECTHWRPIEVK